MPSAFCDRIERPVRILRVLERGPARPHHAGDLLAEPPHERLEVVVLQELAAAHPGERRDRVDHRVVHELLPDHGVDALDDLGGEPGPAEHRPDGAQLVGDLPVGRRHLDRLDPGAVAHPVRPGVLDAVVGDAGEDAPRVHHPADAIHVPDAVLRGEDPGPLAHHRERRPDRPLGLVALHRHEEEIGGGQPLHRGHHLQPDVPLARLSLGEVQPLLGQEPRPRDVRLEEGDVLPRLAEPRADEAAERSGSQDHDAHGGSSRAPDFAIRWRWAAGVGVSDILVCLCFFCPQPLLEALGAGRTRRGAASGASVSSTRDADAMRRGHGAGAPAHREVRSYRRRSVTAPSTARSRRTGSRRCTSTARRAPRRSPRRRSRR